MAFETPDWLYRHAIRTPARARPVFIGAFVQNLRNDSEHGGGGLPCLVAPLCLPPVCDGIPHIAAGIRRRAITSL